MSPHDLVAEAGQLLRSTREARRLSQARLAERVGISQQRLSKLERGAVDPRLGDLARLFAGLQLRLRIETAPPPEGPTADPDLLLDRPEEERLDGVFFLCRQLRKFEDVPHAVVGRLAAVAHGLPVLALRIDLLVAHQDRPQLSESIGRLGAVRWNERWQEFRDHLPAGRPGPMRWLLSDTWELRVTLVDELPDRIVSRLCDQELWLPPLPWLLASDPDLADLLERLRRQGWHRPAGWPAGE